MDEHKSDIPPFTISEETRARLIWIAVEEQVSYSNAADVLAGYYTVAKSMGRDLQDLHAIMTLSKDLKVREISARDVHFALALRLYLAENGLNKPDLDTAVHLLKLLQQFGLTAKSPQVATILELACRIDASGASLVDIEHWLAHRTKGSTR